MLFKGENFPKGHQITFSGHLIEIKDPDPEKFCIEDIAHGLSSICRFGGQTRRFYSVAEHSVIGAGFARESVKLDFLMHDASEAYIHDIIRPVKSMLAGYQALEDMFMTRLAAKFGFTFPLSQEIITLDNDLLQKEFDALMVGEQRAGDIHFPCYEPVIAEKLFLETYNLLKNKS